MSLFVVGEVSVWYFGVRCDNSRRCSFHWAVDWCGRGSVDVGDMWPLVPSYDSGSAGDVLEVETWQLKMDDVFSVWF